MRHSPLSFCCESAALVGPAAFLTSGPPPPSGGAVLVPSPPEFEGEEDHSRVSGSPRSVPAVNSAKVPPAANTTGNTLVAPLMCVRKTLAGVQGPASKVQDDAKRIADAYNKYFDHIRFRNGWAEPQFTRHEVKDLFDEAAYIVARIRQYLDGKAKGEARLRQLDGEAQKFLHGESAAAMVKKNPRSFVLGVVDATFRDAIGYVEGLNRATVVQLVAEINLYQYNPRVHALHVVARLEDLLKRAPLPAETLLLSNEQTALSENAFYVADGSPGEIKWRDSIKKLYAALEDVEQTLKAKTS